MQATLLGFVDEFTARGEETVFVHRPRLRVRAWSGRLIAEAAARFSQELKSRNISKGDRVLFWARNSPEWVCAFLGCIMRGVVAVPLDVQSSSQFAGRVREQTAPKLLLYSTNLKSRASELNIPAISLDHLSDVIRRQPALPESTPITEDDLVEIIYTSGTTAEPKGVCLTHGNLTANLSALDDYVQPYLKWERFVHPLRFLSVLPLSHVFGQLMGIFVPQLIKAQVHFCDSLNPTDVMDLVRRQRINAIVTIPRLLESLRDKVERTMEADKDIRTFERALSESDRWHFLRRWLTFRKVHRQFGWRLWAFVSGGATLGRETEDFWSRLGYLVVQGYGMTETASLISYNKPSEVTRGSIGRTLPGQEVKVDETGEILVRGANVSPGYWKQGIQRFTDEGWFRTGDIGEMDEHGNLYFRGRKKDMIATAAGLKIFPEDIEAALNRQPQVRESAVIGIDGPHGPEPFAFLLLREAVSDPQRIVDQANDKLSEYQRVRRWLVWPEPDFPRTTTTRKVRKRDLAERLKVQMHAAVPSIQPANISQAIVGSAMARVRGGEVELKPSATLSEGLNLDSLGRVELLSELEDRYLVELDEAAFTAATTVADVEQMIQASVPSRARTYPYPEWPQSSPPRLLRVLALSILILPLVRLLGWIRVRGKQRLKAVKAPVLFICNHVTAIDAAIVLAALPGRFNRRMAIAMIGEWISDWRHPPPGTRWTTRIRWRLEYVLVLCLFNVFSLPQESGFRRSFSFAGSLMDKGYNLLVFPEGQRTPDGRLGPFMKGIGLMAAGLEAPVVPIRIDGLFELRNRKRFFALPGEIRVTFGNAVEFDETITPADITTDLERRMREIPAFNSH